MPLLYMSAAGPLDWDLLTQHGTEPICYQGYCVPYEIQVLILFCLLMMAINFVLNMLCCCLPCLMVDAMCKWVECLCCVDECCIPAWLCCFLLPCWTQMTQSRERRQAADPNIYYANNRTPLVPQPPMPPNPYRANEPMAV